MAFKDLPIQKKLIKIIILISGAVLFVTCTTFFAYEYYKFRKTIMNKLSTIGKIISSNSTAAIAFNDPENAKEILSSLKTEPHIVEACLYDKNGIFFAGYSGTTGINTCPVKPGPEGYRFSESHLEGFEPVIEGNKQLGTLYLKSDLKDINERLLIYSLVMALVIIISFMLTYLLSRILEKSISTPILDLAKTAKIISEQKDYSVRAAKSGNDELGLLTDAFNQMLTQIQEQTKILNEFNQKLEQKVKARTIELENANKELEQFAYVASHDLQEPLRTISNFIGLLEKKYSGKSDKDTDKYITFIVAASYKMQNLIKDLLEFSRVGKNIEFVSIDCNKILNEVIADMEASITENNAKITSSVLPVLRGSEMEFKRLFQNLISNAIKFHKKNIAPEITISVEEKDTEYIFSLKDNGIGIEKQFQDKIFIIFQRLHPATEYPGTGIGLSTCKKIVSLHHGKIWVKSELNEGVTFYFSISKKI
ncbi:MAG: HAMP domain-containing protein [Bacteroidetes bacterium]|nr:HAMP domain-containing protein [Bacteroidota bacterium]